MASRLTTQCKKVIVWEAQHLEKGDVLVVKRFGNRLHVMTIHNNWAAIGQSFQVVKANPHPKAKVIE